MENYDVQSYELNPHFSHESTISTYNDRGEILANSHGKNDDIEELKSSFKILMGELLAAIGTEITTAEIEAKVKEVLNDTSSSRHLEKEKNIDEDNPSTLDKAILYLMKYPHWILEMALEDKSKVSEFIIAQAVNNISQLDYRRFVDFPEQLAITEILAKSMSLWIHQPYSETIIGNLVHYHPDLFFYLLPTFKKYGVPLHKRVYYGFSAALQNPTAAMDWLMSNLY